MVLPLDCASLTSDSTRPTTSGPMTPPPSMPSSSRPTEASAVATSSGVEPGTRSTDSASHFRGTLGMSDLQAELLGEAHVALDHVTHVSHSMAEHQRALDAHAEGERGVLLGVNAGGDEHIGVCHAAAADLDPAGAAARAACRIGAAAHEAAHIHLRAG